MINDSYLGLVVSEIIANDKKIKIYCFWAALLPELF